MLDNKIGMIIILNKTLVFDFDIIVEFSDSLFGWKKKKKIIKIILSNCCCIFFFFL